MRKNFLILIGIIFFYCLTTVVFSADIVLGTDEKKPGETAVIPVNISNDLDAVNMITFDIDIGTILPAPSPVNGTDQTNISAEYCFADNISSGKYRITAFVTTIPNIVAGAGEVICLEFVLTGIPEGTYPITISSPQIFDIYNANVTGTATGGSIIVNASSGINDWMLLK